MGSPISGLIAETVLQRLERLGFAVISPNFWRTNIDDTVIIQEDQASVRPLYLTVVCMLCSGMIYLNNRLLAFKRFNRS